MPSIEIFIPAVDPNLPKTSVKLSMLNGKTIEVEFNKIAKVKYLYEFVAKYV